MGLRKQVDKTATPTVGLIDGKKKLNILQEAVADNIVFSDTEQWAVYKLAPQPYEYLLDEDKVTLARRLMDAFVAIMSDRQYPLDFLLTVEDEPFDVDAWKKQSYVATTKHVKPAPGYPIYADIQAQMLSESEFSSRVAYLAIKLGDRFEVAEADENLFQQYMKQIVVGAKKFMNYLTRTRAGDPTPEEEQLARAKEAEMFQIISTSELGGVRVPTAEILLNTKRLFYPAMPTPYLDVDPHNRAGAFDLNLEYGHLLDNSKRKYLGITQIIDDEEVTGYRAVLTLTGFPKIMSYPNSQPFASFLEHVGSNATIYSRFSLFPVERMASKTRSERRKSKDEVDDAAKAADAYEANIQGLAEDINESLRDLSDLEKIVTMDKSPWFEGSFNIVITDTTPAGLRKQFVNLRQLYAGLGITVTWRGDEQLAMFLEQMFGDRKRVYDADQTAMISMLATSGANFNVAVGDRIKPLNNYVSRYGVTHT